ncbi:MAG TPA: ABC transporter permease [Candidatus Acidoferrum sp.]|nr:ABC transporter permease [Candidatus Acidoferrum sp.]
MSTIREWLNRLRFLADRRQFDREMSDELQFHIEARSAELQESGLAPQEAMQRARQEFGSLQLAREDSRQAWRIVRLEDFLQDLRVGFRMLRRSPGFSLLAIVCLTLGIGANAAVFSWVEGILFRPYPAVAHQERLMALAGTTRGDNEPTALSWRDFQDLQKNCKLFDSFFVSKIMGTTLSIGDRAEREPGSIVSANYFDALGVHPILGRGFLPGEDTGSAAHPVTVISYQLWQSRFHGDPNIIGKTQRLNGVVHTIVGVAPEDFRGTFVGWAMQFWVPASMEEIFENGGYKLEDRGARWIESYARLKPGVTREQAQQEISSVASRLETDYPLTNRGRNVRLWALWETPFNGASMLLPILGIMLVVVACVLLIACANVGNLLLVRSFARRHEMTVRAAIGAGRGRLLKQLLTEGLILSFFAAAGGLLVAHWSRHLLVLLFPSRSGISVYLPGDLDWRVLALTAGVCLLATLILGLVPAIQASKIDLAAALKSEMGGVVGGHGKSWVRSGLVVVQVSLSFILLVGTGLLVQSLQKIRTTSPGFSTHRVLSTSVDLISAGYTPPQAKTFQDELLDRAVELPGVESAAFARVTPLGFATYSSSPIAVDGYNVPPEEEPTVEYNEVGPGYFGTMGIPLISGREFLRSDDDAHQLVAVVNETMAAQFWKSQSPIGQRLQVKGRWMQVIGVAKDSKYESLRELPRPFFYVSRRQNFSPNASLNIRTPLGAHAMANALARAIQGLDANLALNEVITLQEQVDRSTSPQRVAVTLLTALGGLALLLAGIGLYGVMSCSVSQSTRELGLRMALGARAGDLMRLVLSQGMMLALGGVALGVVAALGLTRLLGSYLFRVSPRDPLAFGSACLVMFVAALAACFLPAWRAVRTDPMRALREE